MKNILMTFLYVCGKYIIEYSGYVIGNNEKHDLKLSRSKCVFPATEVEFLGHIIDFQGIQKAVKHIEAVLNAPKPSTSKELQLVLGNATL